jgi:hypothetical protein
MKEIDRSNGISTVLRIIGWLTYIGGFIIGIVATVDAPYSLAKYGPFLTVAYWSASFISGSIFLGFAEIINLLQELVNIGLITKNDISKTYQQNDFSDLPEL